MLQRLGDHIAKHDLKPDQLLFSKSLVKPSATNNAPSYANTTGHLPRDTWRRVWKQAVTNAGIDWLPRTHDLRHANATVMLKNGVDLHEVKERLGHSSIRTTEGYLHRMKSQQSKASDAVSEFL
jgi:site-specific recombinase XerD